MNDIQIKEAFAEWLKRWIKDKYGVYPTPENKYKPYRRFTEDIHSNYATVKSWLDAHSFPDEKNILKICGHREIEIQQFWSELQTLDRELNRQEKVITSPFGEKPKTAEEVIDIVSDLPKEEIVKMISLLATNLSK
jgi:hypothetical protein